jgi:hypothetical protein
MDSVIRGDDFHIRKNRPLPRMQLCCSCAFRSFQCLFLFPSPVTHQGTSNKDGVNKKSAISYGAVICTRFRGQETLWLSVLDCMDLTLSIFWSSYWTWFVADANAGFRPHELSILPEAKKNLAGQLNFSWDMAL